MEREVLRGHFRTHTHDFDFGHVGSFTKRVDYSLENYSKTTIWFIDSELVLCKDKYLRIF